MKRKIAKWWLFVFIALVLVTFFTSLAYMMGADKVRMKTGATINIDRSADYNLFRINDQYALYFRPGSSDVSLATYEKEKIFRFLGTYVYKGDVLAQAYKNGDWYYTNYPGYYDTGRTIAVNGKSGQTIKKEEPANDDPAFFPDNLKRLGLAQDESNKLTENDLQHFERMSVPKESAIVLLSGFAIVIIIWLLILPFAFRKVKVDA